MTDALWQLGGWTMIHFLWLGTAVALVGGALRFACRRATPNMRYAVSLLTLAALAALPIAIAAWLALGVDFTARLQPRALPGGNTTVEREPTSTPGQSPGLQPAAPRVIDLAATPLEPASPHAIEHTANPSPSPFLQGRGMSVAKIVPWLPWLWLIGAPLTFALLASGLVGSERLRRKCTPLTDGPAAAACEQLRQAMRITRRVSVAVCDHLAQPVLIGILRPLILLPASALSGWTPAELEMVLVHELAHVRRWDNLVNLLQRIIESALFFHPAVWLVSRQVRRDREECCDAVVVSRIERPHDYAALLVSIAAKMQSRRPAALAAASAMADHPLTGRVRRILKLEDEPMWISRRTLAFTLALPLLLVAAAIYSGAAAQDPPPSNDTTEHQPPEAAGAQGVSPPRSEDSEGVEQNNAPTSKEERPPPVLYPGPVPQVGGAGVAAEFPADTDPDAIRKAQEELERSGKKVTIEINADGRKRLVYVPAPTEADDDEPNPPIDAEIELPRLMHRIKRLEDRIAETNKDLVNVEIFKQLALQSARSPAAVEKAVAESLDNDPTIATFQQKLFELQELIQGHSEESKNLDDEKRKQLTKKLQQTEQEMQQHRAAVEKAAREQIAKMPNEAYRAAIVEHKIRFQAATANLKKYQDELSEANRKLDELVRSNSAGKETVEPIYAIAYPVADVETIDFQRWMQLVSSDQRIDVRWFEKNKSLVVNAPKSGHKQISELFSETRDKSGDPGVEERLGVAADENPFAPIRESEPSANWPPRAGTRESYFWSPKPGSLEARGSKQAAAAPAVRPLMPGDEIKIVAQGAFPEWPLDNVYSIEEAGSVALGPAYGRISVAGQTVIEAEKTVQAHLEAILTDVEVQITLHQRAANAPQNPGDGNAIYLYDGKPFDQWRDLWKHELNTNRRTEAIEALAAFARAGYGKEAAETILDVAGEYAFNSSYKSPEGKLEQRVTQVLTLGRASRVPATDWLPALMDRFARDPDKWRPLMTMLISGGVPEKDYTLDQATRKLLLQIASDPKYGPNAAALRSLYSRSFTGKGDPISDPEVAPLIKAALTGEDAANALAVLRMLSFGQLDQWPQQFEFLFHQDAAARRTARTILQWSSSPSREAVADRLIAVLDDPKRAENHADAIRALGVLARPRNNQIAGRREGWPDEATIKELHKRFEQITREGPPELVAPALVAMGIDGVDKIDGVIKMSGESEEFKERIKQARDRIEAETEQLVDPPNLGGGMGGGGMGGGGGGFF